MTAQRHYPVVAIPAFRVRRVAGCTCGMRGTEVETAAHLKVGA